MAESKFYIWTVGCQMNVADSGRASDAMLQAGYGRTEQSPTPTL
ncbi:MAG: hypothetical protein WKH64_02075 [Chloroflexia bacterium]